MSESRDSKRAYQRLSYSGYAWLCFAIRLSAETIFEDKQLLATHTTKDHFRTTRGSKRKCVLLAASVIC